MAIALTSDEKEILRLFLTQMSVLRRVRLFKRRRKPISVSITILPGTGLKSKIKNLQMDYLRSALASLRQFYAQGERIYVNRVCNILEKHKIDKNLLLWVRAALRNWKRTLKSCPSHYFVGNDPLIVKDAMDLFLNAVVFHSDLDKVRKWEQLAPDE